MGKEGISKILDSLTTNNDQLWPKENWPPMIFRNGFFGIHKFEITEIENNFLTEKKKTEWNLWVLFLRRRE